MASHGGMREGSGRPLGATNKATSKLKLNLPELAREHTNDAVDTLVEVMKSGQSDSARVAAATVILNRVYGKPSMTHTLSGLTKHSLVGFRSHPKDGRSKCVWITDAGRGFVGQAVFNVGPEVTKTLSHLSADHVSALVNDLAHIRKLLDAGRG